MNTLILGVGNPILGNDGAGIAAARKLKTLMRSESVEVRESATGGIPLVEQLLDYDRVLLIDAVMGMEIGEIAQLSPQSFEEGVHSSGLHDVDFRTSLELIKSMYPERMPRSDQIKIFGIGIGEGTEFSERLSPEVERGVEKVVEMILSEFSCSVEGNHES